MSTIRNEAAGYKPKQTKNVADLPQLDVDAELLDGKGTDDSGTEFKYKYIDVNGEEYRIPNVVIGNIKDLLEMNPKLKLVKVSKKGQGLQTRYTVMPLI